jgi:glycerol uptake facilitator-like aquaporin
LLRPGDCRHDSRLLRRCPARSLGPVVIGSGIAATQPSPGNLGLELLENAAATAGGLYTLLLVFGPLSGAHLNPVVSAIDALFGGISWREVAAYLPAQFGGCCCGAVLANLMFSRAVVSLSTHDRVSAGHLLGEVVATAGLVLVIFSLAGSGRAERTPATVATYIGAGYFFTSSTSFANPAIAVGRMLSDTFAGIAPSSVPPFVLAEAVGGVVGFGLLRALFPRFARSAARAVALPHHDSVESSVDFDAMEGV